SASSRNRGSLHSASLKSRLAGGRGLGRCVPATRVVAAKVLLAAATRDAPLAAALRAAGLVPGLRETAAPPLPVVACAVALAAVGWPRTTGLSARFRAVWHGTAFLSFPRRRCKVGGAVRRRTRRQPSVGGSAGGASLGSASSSRSASRAAAHTRSPSSSPIRRTPWVLRPITRSSLTRSRITLPPLVTSIT